MSDSPRRIGLVVGAGGPTGGPFIHAALDALRRHTSWDPSAATTVVGTSAGAFVAASFADATRAPAEREWVDTFALANGHRFVPSTLDRGVALFRRSIGRFLAMIAPVRRPFAAYNVPSGPFHPGARVVTVSRRGGRRHVHELDDAADVEAVVRASAAIPALNKPVEVNGALHVDGALHSAANVDVVEVHRHDGLVVIAPMVGESGGSLVTRIHRAQLRSQLAPWIAEEKPVVVVVPNEAEHANRRDVDTFRPAGTAAVSRLLIDNDSR